MSKFVKFTTRLDNDPVYINIDNIKAISQYCGRSSTAIVYGLEDGYIEVSETIDEVMKKISEAQNE